MPLVTQTGFKGRFQGEVIDKGTVAEPTGVVRPICNPLAVIRHLP